MAKELTAEASAAEAEKKKLKEEKIQLKKEQKEQKRDAKRRAKEISRQEEELDDDGNGLVTFFATILIVALWLAVICVIVKLDIGGFGSSVLTPILKDVPVVNKILPGSTQAGTDESSDSYSGYSSLQEAVDYIKQLELELERAQNASTQKDTDMDALRAEVLRLQEFEKRQTEFQRIETEFYEEVVYTDKGPGAEEYRKWYEEMNPTTAEFLYKQVIVQLQESKEIQEYAQAYSEMKPKQAAGIFEEMTDNLNLAAKILNAMNAEDRGSILGVMDAEVAAKLTKIMDPDS